MDKDDLLKKLSKTLTKAKTIKIALVNGYKPLELISLSLYPQNEIAFRASWVLEQFLYYRWDELIPSLPDFMEGYLIQENRSCQRHFTKIMMELTEKGKATGVEPLLNKYQDQVIEITFGWLIDADTPVAVKVNCMDILLYFSKKHPWITDELCAQVQFLMKDGSAAIQSRGKKIIKKLKAC